MTPCVEKIFKFIVFTFLEIALNLGIFTHAPSSLLKTRLPPPSSYDNTQGRGKLLTP